MTRHDTDGGAGPVVQDEPAAREAAPPSADKTSSRWINRLIQTPEAGVIIVAVVVFIAIASQSSAFYGITNLQNMGLDLAEFGILAVGEAMVMLTGGIDLSPGSMVALTGVLAAWLDVKAGIPFVPAIILTLIAGIAIGVAHGLFVTRLDVPPFVITLVTYTAAAGGALAITHGFPINGISSGFGNLAQVRLAGVPLPAIIFIVVALIAWFYLERTYLGRQLYAVGGNREAARLAGIRSSRHTISVYVVSATLSSIVGILVVGRLGVGEPGVATGWELDAIAAAVIGGVSLFGGVGRMLGVTFGAILLVIINNGLVILHVSPYYQQIVLGAVLGIAITSDRLRARRQGRTRSRRRDKAAGAHSG